MEILPSIGSSGDGYAAGDRPHLWPTHDAAQQNAAHLMSFETKEPPPHGPISTMDLYTTLKVTDWELHTHTFLFQMLQLVCFNGKMYQIQKLRYHWIGGSYSK